MQFKVKITETFERIVTVEAETESDAVANATTEYLSFDGTLDESGLVHFKVELHEEK